MGGKIKDFQKIIVDDSDWKDTISGEHVCELDPNTISRPGGLSVLRWLGRIDL